MRRIIQDIATNAVALFILQLFLKGLVVRGGVASYILSGGFIFLGDTILKPILSIISLPFNILTMGLFSTISNGAALFLVTYFYKGIQISGFLFPAISYKTIQTPSFYMPTIFAYIMIAFAIELVKRLIYFVYTR